MNGLHNVLIPRATAKVTGKGIADLCFAWRWVSRQKLMRTHDHSWRAVTALEAVFFPEAFLKRMKPPILRHTFDRDDVCAVCLNRKYRARLYREPIGQDRTCATNTGFAANVGAGQAGHIADEVG